MNCSVGHDVPGTSEVMTIAVSAVELTDWSTGEADSALDGAVRRPARSDPHATSGRMLRRTALAVHRYLCKVMVRTVHDPCHG